MDSLPANIRDFRNQAFMANSRSAANLAHDRWRDAIKLLPHTELKAACVEDFNHNCDSQGVMCHTDEEVCFFLFENRTHIKL